MSQLEVGNRVQTGETLLSKSQTQNKVFLVYRIFLFSKNEKAFYFKDKIT